MRHPIVPICLCYVLMIAPVLHAAKQADKKGPAKKAEFSEKKLVEKVKDTNRSRGTNIVWTTGREFPLMFSRPDAKAKKTGKK